MYLLTDFINPQGNIAFANRLDKIKHNISLIDPMKNNIDEQKRLRKKAFTTMTVLGRWIVVYQANIINDDDTIMYFIDFRFNLAGHQSAEIFSPNTLDNIIKLQTQYDNVFKEKYNMVELSYAEPFETIVKPNLFVCGDDKIVLAKAKSLGILPAIENLKPGDTVKVIIVDESVKVDDDYITNVYAVIHFGGHSIERQHDNGFTYIKIYNLKNNFDKVNDFEAAIQNAGGRFDRSFFMERFDKVKLN